MHDGCLSLYNVSEVLPVWNYWTGWDLNTTVPIYCLLLFGIMNFKAEFEIKLLNFKVHILNEY